MRPQSAIIELDSSPEPQPQPAPHGRVTRSTSCLRSCSPPQIPSKTNPRKQHHAQTRQPSGSKTKPTEKATAKTLGPVIELTDSDDDDENIPLRLAPRRPASQSLSQGDKTSSQPTRTNAFASGSGSGTRRTTASQKKGISDGETTPKNSHYIELSRIDKGKRKRSDTAHTPTPMATINEDEDKDNEERGYAVAFKGTFTKTKATTTTVNRVAPTAGPSRVQQTPAGNHAKEPTPNAPTRPTAVPAAPNTPTPRAPPTTPHFNPVAPPVPVRPNPPPYTMQPPVQPVVIQPHVPQLVPPQPHGVRAAVNLHAALATVLAVRPPVLAPAPPAPVAAPIPVPPPAAVQPLSQPPAPAAAPARPRAEIIASATTQILEIIPDVQRVYLSRVLEANIDKLGERTAEAVLEAMFENPGEWPREVPGGQRADAGPAAEQGQGAGAGDKGKGRAREEDAGDAGGQPDAKRARIDYASPDRPHEGGMRYENLALLALGCSFPYIPKLYIRQQLAKNRGHYAPTHFTLRMEEARGEAREYVQKSIPFNVLREARKLETCTGMDKVFDSERAWVLEREANSINDKGQPRGANLPDNHAGQEQQVAPELQDKGKGKAVAEEDDELEDGTGIECQCCFGESAFDKMVQCPEAHLFCSDCISQYAKTQLGEHNASLVCMHSSGCALPFPVSELKRVLDPQLMDLYDRVTQAKAIEEAEIEGLEECPFCEWKCVWEVGEEQTRFWCGNKERCGVVSCRKCKKKDHLPKSCEEAEADKHLGGRIAIEEAMTRALMRNCPKCHKAFIKEQGCNKMTCPNCRTLSCYVCRQIIHGYDHFTQNQPGLPSTSKTASKCLLWDQVEERHANEVKAAAEKAIADYKRDHPDVNDAEIKVDIPLAPPPPIVPNPPPHGHHVHRGLNPMLPMHHGNALLGGAAAAGLHVGLIGRFNAHHGGMAAMAMAGPHMEGIDAQVQAQLAVIQVAREREAIRREAKRVAAAEARERKRQRQADKLKAVAARAREQAHAQALEYAHMMGRVEAQEDARLRAEAIRVARERERERQAEAAAEVGRMRAAEVARVEAENLRVARVQARMQAEVQNRARNQTRALAAQQAQARASAEAKAQRTALAKVKRRTERNKGAKGK